MECFTEIRKVVRDDCVVAQLVGFARPDAQLPLYLEAMELALDIAGKSPVGMRSAKFAYNTIETMPQRDGYRFEQNITRELSFSEDSREAKRAFIEKLKPVFKDR